MHAVYMVTCKIGLRSCSAVLAFLLVLFCLRAMAAFPAFSMAPQVPQMSFFGMAPQVPFQAPVDAAAVLQAQSQAAYVQAYQQLAAVSEMQRQMQQAEVKVSAPSADEKPAATCKNKQADAGDADDGDLEKNSSKKKNKSKSSSRVSTSDSEAENEHAAEEKKIAAQRQEQAKKDDEYVRSYQERHREQQPVQIHHIKKIASFALDTGRLEVFARFVATETKAVDDGIHAGSSGQTKPDQKENDANTKGEPERKDVTEKSGPSKPKPKAMPAVITIEDGKKKDETNRRLPHLVMSIFFFIFLRLANLGMWRRQSGSLSTRSMVPSASVDPAPGATTMAGMATDPRISPLLPGPLQFIQAVSF